MEDAYGFAIWMPHCTADRMDFQDLEIHGSLHLQEAQLRGSLTGSRMKIQKPRGGVAVNLDQCSIGGRLDLSSAELQGVTRLIGSKLSGQLDLSDARLVRHTSDRTLVLDGATIAGGMFASKLRSEGCISAIGLRLDGQLIMKQARLSNAGKTTLILDSASVQFGWFASDLESLGELRAVDSVFAGAVNFSGASLESDDDALSLNRSTIRGQFTGAEMKIRGRLGAPRATFSNSLRLTSANLSSGGAGVALDLTGASIRELRYPTSHPSGQVSLRDCSVDVLYLPRQGGDVSQSAILLQGWKIKDIAGAYRNKPRLVAGWLLRARDIHSKGFPLQPWLEIAAVYERNGQPADARWLRWRAARHLTRQSPGTSRIFPTIYGWLTGHGYYPLAAAVWLLVAFFVSFVLALTFKEVFIPTATNRAQFAATVESTEYGPITGAVACEDLTRPTDCFRPVLFALDTVLPVASSTGQATEWRPYGEGGAWLSLTLSGLRIFSWLLVVILLAGITGLLRKD